MAPATNYGSSAGKSEVFLVLCASLGALNFGYTIGFSAPALPSLVSEKVFRDEDVGWFGSLMTVGALLGGPVSGWCIDKVGRKRTILFSSLPFLLGYASMIVTQSVTVLFAARFLTGLGSGMVCVCVPMYIAEIASKSRRGTLGSCVEINIVVGIFLAFLVGLSKDWKRLAYAALLPAVLACIGTCVLPESPRWLLTRNRKREAAQALASVRGGGGGGGGAGASEELEEELRDMEEGIRAQSSVSWSELTSQEELRRPLILSVSLFVFQQLSGISAVMYYTVTIFNTLIPDHAYVATVILGFAKMVVTIFACMQLDHAGRKILVKVGGSLMGVSLFLFGMCYHLPEEHQHHHGPAAAAAAAAGADSGAQGGVDTAGYGSGVTLTTWLPVLCLTSANIGFAIGWGAVPFLFMSEVFPAQCRGKAGSITMFAHWLAAFVVTKQFQSLQVILGRDGVFYFFSLCCALGVGFVWKYLPETKGRSLEEIQQYFLLQSGAKG